MRHQQIQPANKNGFICTPIHLFESNRRGAPLPPPLTPLSPAILKYVDFGRTLIKVSKMMSSFCVSSQSVEIFMSPESPVKRRNCGFK
jgi:hypothetical protein